MNNYSVYKHKNKINGKVYIGITKQCPKKRWDNGNGYKDNTHFYNAIKKYGWNSFEHIILFKGLSKEEAQVTEIKLIEEYKSNNRKFGYNKSKGGETYNENFKRKFGKDNHKSRRIRQLDIYGNLINIFESQNIASKVLGIKRQGITKNCLGQSRIYKGFIFEYDDCNFKKPAKKYVGIGKHKNHHTTKVKCIDDDLIFESIKKAGEYYNIRPNNIASCLCESSKTKTAGGKRWCRWH